MKTDKAYCRSIRADPKIMKGTKINENIFFLLEPDRIEEPGANQNY